MNDTSRHAKISLEDAKARIRQVLPSAAADILERNNTGVLRSDSVIRVIVQDLVRAKTGIPAHDLMSIVISMVTTCCLEQVAAEHFL